MWKVIGASVPGNSHKENGTRCQDASGWRSHADVTCLAVADGAGSRPSSGAGSALAVERALLVAAKRADPLGPMAWVRAAFEDAREQIAGMAASAGHTPDEYATTLALAILTPDAITVGQVGDSIVVAETAGQYRTIDPDVKGEYVNETAFITGPDWLDHLRISVMPADATSMVALSTDGLRYKILSHPVTATPFGPFFADLVSYVRSPEASCEGIMQFLTGLDDQTGDDKTLLAAVRVDPPAHDLADVRSAGEESS